MGQRIVPHVTEVARVLDGVFSGASQERWRTWWERYFQTLRTVLMELSRRAGLKSQAQARRVAAAIDPLLPPERRAENLSRKALWAVASSPGVSVVLNGMRTPAYVEDALGILQWPSLGDPASVYRAIREAYPVT